MRARRAAARLACAAATVVSLLLVLAGPRARAAEPRARIALVARGDDPSSGPLADELRALGFEVVAALADDGAPSPEGLAEIARAHAALAALRLAASDRGVEVWLADRVTGKVVLREIVRPTDGGELGSRVVVLRAVELLRASFMEIDAPHVPRGEVAPPEAVRATVGPPAPPPRPRVGLAAGPGVLVGNEALGLTGGASLRLDVRIGERGSLGAVAFVPISGATTVAPEGRATLALLPFGLDARWALARPGARLCPWIGLGGGLASLRADVTPSAGFLVADERRLVAWAAALVGASWRLGPRWQLGLVLTAGTLPARPVVRFDGRDVADVGRWFALGGLTVEVGL